MEFVQTLISAAEFENVTNPDLVSDLVTGDDWWIVGDDVIPRSN